MSAFSILIVDDEEANCENLADILEMSGHDVVWCCDPEEAISIVEGSEQRKFDVAIIDLKMPKMNGVELLVKIKKTNPFIQSILISAYVDIGVIDEDSKDLFEVVLSKPVNVDFLLTSLKQLVPVVLCVDDDEDYCETLTEIFDTNGVQSFFGHSVESAQEKLLNNNYDVAIVDLRLPDGNGLAVVELLKKTNPGIGIIVISGFPNDISEMSSNDDSSQINAIYEKPIDSNQLLKKIFEINQSNVRGRFENLDS